MNFDLLEKQLNQISHNYYYQTYANNSLARSFANDNKYKIQDTILYMRQYPEGVISLRYLSNDFFLKHDQSYHPTWNIRSSISTVWRYRTK